jgi:hypothetical protein
MTACLLCIYITPEESELEINDELYLFVIDPMAERVLTAN